MKRMLILLGAAASCAAALSVPATPAATAQGGWTTLFNGRDFTNWKTPAGDNGHWKIVDGVIDYDGESEAPGEKHLWTERSFGDFEAIVEWRIKDTPYLNPNVPIILPNGLHKKGPDGKDVRMVVPDSDSGVLLRGDMKSQMNIWCWPVGSGEVYGYRMDGSMPAAVRAGVTPRLNADHNIGEWNKFEFTMKGDRLTLNNNGHTVLINAQLPGIAPRGPLGLQHHGGKRDGKWVSPPALVQFRNIRIREL